MREYWNRRRKLAGMLLAPLLYLLLWKLTSPGFDSAGSWLFLVHITFFILAGFSHLVLRMFRLESFTAYCMVMFAVTLILDLSTSLWTASGYEALYHSRTQVVLHGLITPAGYTLIVTEAFKNAFSSALVMALFWFIACYHRPIKAQPA